MKKSKVILIIDDEFIILESIKIQLSRFLDEDSHTIECGSSGDEAFSIISEYYNNAVNIDLIITDYHLDDTKGTDIIYFLHKKFPNSKKIILTGESENILFDENEKGIIINANITKPWEFEELKNHVLNALEN